MRYSLPGSLEEMEADLAAIERRRCEASLLEFFKRAWREVDPAPLRVNWHHASLAAHLEAVARGEIKVLIFNIPPRFTKTLLANVCFPAWLWIQPEVGPLTGPQVKTMSISYGQTLSEEIAITARRLVQSEWYQKHWGDRVKMSKEIARVDFFGNEAGGFRIATSITGSVLGRGSDIRLIDDALSVDQAESKVENEKVNRMYREALQTRSTDPAHTAEIVIMQRLREDDLTGYILSMDRDDVVHVVYPMRHDPGRHCDTDWFEDPRQEPGELLWPERFDEAAVRRLEQNLGPYAFAGQMQQAPTPRGGGIFQREWIQPWPPVGPDGEILEGWILQRNGQRAIRYPSFEFICACVDTAFTDKKQNDPCAMTVWGIFRGEGESRIDRMVNPDGSTGYVRVDEPQGVPRALIMFGWQKHLKLNGARIEKPVEISDQEWNGPVWREYRQKGWGLVEWVVDTCRRWKVQHLRIETQGQGHGLEDEMHRLHGEHMPWTVELVPTARDKVAMANSVVPVWTGGQVVLPQYEDGSFPTWLTPIVDEWMVFPRGRHDDATDTMTSALRMMRERGMLEREEEIKADESMLAQYERRHRRVPLPYHD